MASILITGMDPGKANGAIATLDPLTMDITVHDMPLGKSPTGKVEMDLRGLATIMIPNPIYSRHIAVIEQVSVMPLDGKVGAFHFGGAYYAMRMAAVGFGYEDRYVTPPVWKKHFKLTSDKGVSLSYVRTRFPKYLHLFERVKDHNRAEAVLLALYGMEVLLPKLPPQP